MPSALLLHGIGNGPAAMWRFAEWLETDGWAVASPALLGHGGRGPAASYAHRAYADDVLDAGDVDLVVGHSLGASVATLAAASRPEWTRRLVVVDPAWRIPQELFGPIVASELAELGWTEADIRREHPSWDERDIAAKLGEAARVAPGALEGTFAENPSWDVVAAANRLTAPTLVITGDPEVFTFVSPELAASVIAANPLVTVRRIPGTGHSPHRDDPAAVRAVLAEWLDKTT